MSRYVIKFYKEGVIRYISHLDLLRLFKRSFKRVGIKLVHSQGFNPHPKMSFAQPLSLGYTSSGELLEFETVDPQSPEDMTAKLNSILPEGVGILSCDELPKEGRSLAALTESADYEIKIPLSKPLEKPLAEQINSYMDSEQILVRKLQKKSGKEVELDIKPMINQIAGKVYDNYIMITCKIASGSTANLSPEMVLSSFCNFSEIPYDRAEISIKRTGIYFSH